MCYVYICIDIILISISVSLASLKRFTSDIYTDILRSMKGGSVIREARKRAGLTQRQLAEFLSTTQAVIARWESGKSSPTFDRVVQAVRTCGLDLSVRIVNRDDEHSLLIDDALRLAPVERLERLTRSRSALEGLTANVRRRSQET